MKKQFTMIVALALAVCLLAACGQPVATGIWADATYTEDATLGDGATTLTMVVSAEDKAITLTIKTNQTTVAAALLEHGLIEGQDGMYTVVNGMTADYNVDQTYWAFYLDDAYANEGMDTTDIQEGVTYRLERSK